MLISYLLLLTSLNIVCSQFLPDRIDNKLERRVTNKPINYVPRHIFDPLIRSKKSSLSSSSLLSNSNDYDNYYNNIDTYWNAVGDPFKYKINNDNYNNNEINNDFNKQFAKYSKLLSSSTKSTKIKKYPYVKCYSIYRTTTNGWCQDNCQLGNCPSTHCICDHGKIFTTVYEQNIIKSQPNNKLVNSKYNNNDNYYDQKQNNDDYGDDEVDNDSYQLDIKNNNDDNYDKIKKIEYQ